MNTGSYTHSWRSFSSHRRRSGSCPGEGKRPGENGFFPNPAGKSLLHSRIFHKKGSGTCVFVRMLLYYFQPPVLHGAAELKNMA